MIFCCRLVLIFLLFKEILSGGQIYKNTWFFWSVYSCVWDEKGMCVLQLCEKLYRPNEIVRVTKKNIIIVGSFLHSIDRIPSNFLKAVFHKFYLVYSWILCPIYLFACVSLLVPTYAISGNIGIHMQSIGICVRYQITVLVTLMAPVSNYQWSWHPIA